jgi:hypothetical protein
MGLSLRMHCGGLRLGPCMGIIGATLLVGWTPPQGPAEGEGLKKLVEAAKRREQVLQDHWVYFCEDTRQEGLSVIVGRAQMGGAHFEKWTRTLVDREQAAAAAERGGLRELFEDLDPLVLEYSLLDGSRTVLLEPSIRKGLPGDPDYLGLLTVTLDPSIRKGALHCGLLFGETWLSTILAHCRVLEKTEEPDGGETWQLVPDEEQDHGIRFEVRATDEGHVQTLRYFTPAGLRLAFFVDRTVVVGGVPMPAEGRLTYEYDPEYPIHTSLAYHPGGALPAEERDLLIRPRELMPDTTARIMDEATGMQIWMGREPPSLSGAGGPGAQDLGGARKDVESSGSSDRGEGGFTAWLPVVVGGILLALLAGLLRGRGAHG